VVPGIIMPCFLLHRHLPQQERGQDQEQAGA